MKCHCLWFSCPFVMLLPLCFLLEKSMLDEYHCHSNGFLFVEDLPDILLLVLRCRGRRDGVLTVRDGGSAPVTPGTPIPPQCIPPRPRPARDPQQPKPHKHNTDELRRGGAPGGGQKRRGRDGRRWLSHSPLASSIPDSSSYKLADHYLRCTQVLHCGFEALATRQLVKTLTNCVDEYQM